MALNQVYDGPPEGGCVMCWEVKPLHGLPAGCEECWGLIGGISDYSMRPRPSSDFVRIGMFVKDEKRKARYKTLSALHDIDLATLNRDDLFKLLREVEDLL